MHISVEGRIRFTLWLPPPKVPALLRQVSPDDFDRAWGRLGAKLGEPRLTGGPVTSGFGLQHPAFWGFYQSLSRL